MFKQLSLAGAALAMGAAALAPTAADAQRYRGDRYQQSYDARYDRGRYGYDQRDYRGYDQRRQYRGNDNRYRAQNRCRGGDTGTIVGALAGGLLGRTIDTRGDRLLGTVLGAGGGALAGRAIERSGQPGYCRR